MTEHDLVKALEVWTLQSLLNISIMVGILALGLAVVQGYDRSLEKHLSLRVSIELWKVFTVQCVGCMMCVDQCPFGAIQVDEALPACARESLGQRSRAPR